MVEPNFNENLPLEAGLASDLSGAYDHNLSSTFTTRKKGRKEPSFVVVACRQCRSRKVRCDSTRPHCNNCTRRSDTCEYDATPKRRGPDKQPGSRKMPGSDAVDGAGSLRSIRGASRNDDRSLSIERDAATISRTGDARSTATAVDFENTVRTLGLATLAVLSRISQNPNQNGENRSNNSPSTHQSHTFTGSPRFIPWGVFDGMRQDDMEHMLSTLNSAARIDALNTIPRGPSLAFSKQTWWDNLLQVYSEQPSQNAKHVFQDLCYVLNNTIYWLSFIHMPTFLEDLFDPVQRVFIQPSVVLSALALSTLMRSSETGLGEKGRMFALWLRDSAQSSLDASLSTGWITPSLSQTAFFLLLFEAHLHPNHTFSRISSAIFILDSLIQGMGLLMTDIHEPDVSIFPAFEIPVALPKPLVAFITPTETVFPNRPAYFFDEDNRNTPSASINSTTGQGFEDDSTLTWETLLDLHPLHQISKEKTRNGSIGTVYDNPKVLYDIDAKWAQRWAHWPATDNRADIQKEETRRLCWSSMILATLFREFAPHIGHVSWNLHITKQENYALFFPGEATSRNDSPFAPKETLWALHCRATLLWNISHRLEQIPDDGHRKAVLASQAWTEILELEESLKRHILERSAFYPGREYLFQLKLMVLNKFSRIIPMTHTTKFSRHQVVDWLTHRTRVAENARKFVRMITRFGAHTAGLALAKRPFGVWWALYQIKTGVTIWKIDPTLTAALEQSLDFLTVVDFMVHMWPSPSHHPYPVHIKEELLEACSIAGIPPPPRIPIPGLASNATMVIPRSFDPSDAADIPILPPD